MIYAEEIILVLNIDGNVIHIPCNRLTIPVAPKLCYEDPKWYTALSQTTVFLTNCYLSKTKWGQHLNRKERS